MAKSRQDLNQEIINVIKSNPGAHDINKTEGSKERVLWLDVLDYIDAMVAAAAGAANGEFPFDWTRPSNAFNGYSNTSLTFKSGFDKFLHRDSPPQAALQTSFPTRLKGTDGDTDLSYSFQPGTAAIASVVVDGTTVPNNPTYGTLSRTTSYNTDTTYTMTVTDVNGAQAQAFAQVRYLNALFIFPNAQNLLNASDAVISNILNSQNGLLTTTYTQQSAQNTQTPNNEFIYVAFPVSFGGNPTFIMNGFRDNSFTFKQFAFTNGNNYTEQYYIFKSPNTLSATYSVVIQ